MKREGEGNSSERDESLDVQELRRELALVREQLRGALEERESTVEARRGKGAERREAQQASVARLGQLALEGGTFAELRQVAVRDAVSNLSADFGEILKLEPDGKSLHRSAAVGWREELLGDAVFPFDGSSATGQVLRTGKTVLMDDRSAASGHTLPVYCEEHEVRSGLVVILGAPSKPIGVLGIYGCEPSNYSQDDVSYLTGIASVLAIARTRISESEAVRETEKRFQMLADNMSQLAWIADSDAYISWYNKRWFEYTGSTKEEMDGFGWEKIIHPDHVQAVKEGFKRNAEAGMEWENIVPLRCADGTYRRFLSRALPIRNEAGEITSWFGTNTDVEQIKAMEDALIEADERKDIFIATLAHELRNPLAPIMTGASILLDPDENLGEQQRQIVEIIDEQTQHLAKLIDDLMEVSRVAGGKVKIEPSRTNLRDVIGRAVSSAKSFLKEGDRSLEVELPEQEVWLDVDRMRMGQVLINLISNAVRYDPSESPVRLVCRVVGDALEIRVIDRGIGIEREMLVRIFDLFAQVEEPGARSRSGLGIGLSLVKSLVEMHDGEVWAESEGPGKGSEFVVRLPISVSKQAEDDSGLKRTGAEDTVHAKKRVLVVDDNRDAANLLGISLRLQKHEVLVAYSGREAVDSGGSFRPEIAVLDLGMPEMDGVATAEAIRKTEWGKSVLLIAATGWGQKEDIERSQVAGFDHHLVKPIPLDKLSEIVLAHTA